MLGSLAISALAQRLRRASGIAAKSDIASVAQSLGLSGAGVIPVGDDCAAIPDGDGYLLFAIEGFMNEFVAGDPWFAGWCGAMVNISDIAAMGGRPIAIVDAIWADGEAKAAPVLAGLRDAAKAFGVPVVGGHTNVRTDRGQLSVAILGRAKKLLTSFDASPGDSLIAAIDLRGRYREPFSNWEAATERRRRGCAATSNCCRRLPKPGCRAPPRTSARAASSAPRPCWPNAPASPSTSISTRSRSRTASRWNAGC